jgi:Tfp pilus assembly protein PilO
VSVRVAVANTHINTINNINKLFKDYKNIKNRIDLILSDLPNQKQLPQV